MIVHLSINSTNGLGPNVSVSDLSSKERTRCEIIMNAVISKMVDINIIVVFFPGELFEICVERFWKDHYDLKSRVLCIENKDSSLFVNREIFRFIVCFLLFLSYLRMDHLFLRNNFCISAYSNGILMATSPN